MLGAVLGLWNPRRPSDAAKFLALSVLFLAAGFLFLFTAGILLIPIGMILLGVVVGSGVRAILSV